jgi:hypothetical protein
VPPQPAAAGKLREQDIRSGARIFAWACLAAILVIMLFSILLSPYLIPFALPVIWGFAIGYRDGWPGSLNKPRG